MKDNDAPYPPELAFDGIEFAFMVMPPGAPFAVLTQAQLKLRPVQNWPSLPVQRTPWFALTPGVAREVAAKLQQAADQAEKPHMPPATKQ